MQPEKGTIVGVGGLRLRYWHWPAAEAPRAILVVLHGIAVHARLYTELAETATERGYAVFALDHRGHGESEGERVQVGRFSDFVDDVHVLVQAARTTYPNLPVFLLGQSMGSLIALQYALRHQDELAGLIVAGVALQIGEHVSPWLKRVGRLIVAVAPSLRVVGVGPSQEPGALLSHDEEVTRRLVADPLCYQGKIKARIAYELGQAAAQARARVAELTLPLLILHGEEDRLANPEGARLLYAQAGSADKTLKLWPGFWHEPLLETGRAEVVALLLSWLDERVLMASALASRATAT
ncbi:MAG TPA: alpha/beta hydrolase [Ardenticatenaceae bacterium]|nr:alpha/beta hydrolase [Ardenticatenaceae bacterium]